MSTQGDAQQANFFRPLRRPQQYSTKSDGTFYSYAYYRGKYHHEVAGACEERCVYCDSHEKEMGGREAMQIDHFRLRHIRECRLNNFIAAP